MRISTEQPTTFYPGKWNDELPIAEPTNLVNVEVLQTTSVHGSALGGFKFLPIHGLPDFGNRSVSFLRIEYNMLYDFWVPKVLNLNNLKCPSV
jgi:hypothetical protein